MPDRMSNSNSFRNPDYQQVPMLASGVPSTNAGRVMSVVERQDELRVRARRYAIDEARPSIVNDDSGREMSWDLLDRSYRLVRVFGNPIDLSFSEGEERDEPDNLGKINSLDKKDEDIRTYHPNYHLECDSLHSAITIRRAPGETTVTEAPSKAVKKGLEALELASDETDSVVVDALISGHSSAVGIRHAESANEEEVFATQFFHDRPFADVEADFLNWIQSSLENEVLERKGQEADFSALQDPIEDFGKALEQSNPNAEVTDLHPGEIGDDKGLPYRVRAFASSLTNTN